MTRQTRLFLWLAGGVLTLGVVAGLVVSYAGSTGAADTVNTALPELKYLSADARMVAAIDLRILTRSALHTAWVERRPVSARQDDPLRQLGLDVEADIDRMLMGASGLRSGAGPTGGLVVAKGRFTVGQVEQHLSARAGRSSDYKGVRIVRFTAADSREAAVAFLEPGLLAVGPPATVVQSIDGANGLNLTGNEEVMRLVRSVQSGHLWAVGQFDLASALARLPGGSGASKGAGASILPSATWFAASARVDRGLDGSVRAEASTEADATNLRELLQGLVALARLQAGSRPGLDTAVNSLQLTTQGTTVSLSFSVPGSAVASLIPPLTPALPTPPSPR